MPMCEAAKCSGCTSSRSWRVRHLQGSTAQLVLSRGKHVPEKSAAVTYPVSDTLRQWLCWGCSRTCMVGVRSELQQSCTKQLHQLVFDMPCMRPLFSQGGQCMAMLQLAMASHLSSGTSTSSCSCSQPSLHHRVPPSVPSNMIATGRVTLPAPAVLSYSAPSSLPSSRHWPHLAVVAWVVPVAGLVGMMILQARGQTGP